MELASLFRQVTSRNGRNGILNCCACSSELIRCSGDCRARAWLPITCWFACSVGMLRSRGTQEQRDYSHAHFHYEPRQMRMMSRPTKSTPARSGHFPSQPMQLPLRNVRYLADPRGEQITPEDLDRHSHSFRKLGVEWVVFSGGEPQLNEKWSIWRRLFARWVFA